MRRLASVLLSAVLAAPAATAAEPACTTERLAVPHAPVVLTLCPLGAPVHAPGGEILLAVRERAAGPTGMIDRTVRLRFLANEPISRAIEDLDLAPLGGTGTLHLTLVFRDGTVAVESAILTPGAVVVK
jgi:hypothetical protein